MWPMGLLFSLQYCKICLLEIRIVDNDIDVWNSACFEILKDSNDFNSTIDKREMVKGNLRDKTNVLILK